MKELVEDFIKTYFEAVTLFNGDPFGESGIILFNIHYHNGEDAISSEFIQFKKEKDDMSTVIKGVLKKLSQLEKENILFLLENWSSSNPVLKYRFPFRSEEWRALRFFVFSN